ncbi:MAG: cyanophycinase [Phycisphaeraceae bacterium]
MRVNELTSAFAFSLWLSLTMFVGLLNGDRAFGDQFPDRGRLVIIGGALKSDHAAIYRAFLEGTSAGSRVAVIPLASGVPERSGPLTVGDLRQYSEEPELIDDTALRHDQPELLKTAEVAGELASCGALWFTGGDQIRILRAMRPETGDTLSYAAVLEVLAKGGTVGGTSAGAAMMSEWMITGGRSADAMLLGANPGYDVPGVGYVQGMGLFGYGLVDQHFLRRGRFGRLLVAMDHLDTRLGFGVSENSAMVVDLGVGEARVIGDHGLTMIDLASSEREGHGWSGVRLSVLSEGDVVDLELGEAAIAEGRVEAKQERVVISEYAAELGVWDNYAVLRMVEALADDRGRVVMATDDNYVYRMTADEESRFFLRGEGDGRSLTAVGVRLDIEPVDGIEGRVAERLAAIERRESE